MARAYHFKGEARSRATLKAQNASEIKHGRAALILEAEKKERK